MTPYLVVFYIFLITGGFAIDDDISSVPHIRQRRFSIPSFVKKYLFDKVLEWIFGSDNKNKAEDPQSNVDKAGTSTETKSVSTEINIVNVINNSLGQNPGTTIVDAPATTGTHKDKAGNTEMRTVPAPSRTSTEAENVATVNEDGTYEDKAGNTESGTSPSPPRISTEVENVATVNEDGTHEDKEGNTESGTSPAPSHTSAEVAERQESAPAPAHTAAEVAERQESALAPAHTAAEVAERQEPAPAPAHTAAEVAERQESGNNEMQFADRIISDIA
ncbi:unnamed protein product [Auanema sp. JU1783]|nr:unnamed protein product [Auanema sp. JU1783]